MPDYGPLYQAAGAQWGVDPLLLQSMAVEESGETPTAIGKPVPGQGRAGGMMQFLPSTAQERNVDAMNPTSAVYGAASYINDLINQHGGDLRKALSTYGGASGPDSDYVTKVMRRYTGLHQSWKGRNFTPPPNTPDTFTPAPGTTPDQPISFDIVPTKTAAADASFDWLKPRVSKSGAPLATETPEENFDWLKPRTDKGGKPLSDTGQYLSAPESPGAQAVGRPIAEERVPGPGFQAKVNIAQDPAQRARIAAAQLFPNDPNAVNRIIVGPEGRLAAVDEKGQPYYIEPRPVFTDQRGITRGEPGGPWEPTSGFAVAPYSRAPPLAPGALSPGNVLSAAAAGAPNALATLLPWAPALTGGPWGTAAVGPATAFVETGRRALGNWMLDPAAAEQRPDILSPETGVNALANEAAAFGFRAGGKLFQGVRPGPRGIGASQPEGGPPGGPGPGLEGHPFASQTQFPGRQPMPMGESAATTARPSDAAIRIQQLKDALETAPESAKQPLQEEIARLEAATPRSEITPVDPFEGAGEASGPYAPVSAAHAAAAPTHASPLTMPLITDAQIEARARQVVNEFAATGNRVPDERALISKGTLAQVFGNPGLSALERLMADKSPLGKTEMGKIYEDQKTATRVFSRRLIGDNDRLTELEAQRERATQPAYEAAFGATTPTSVAAALAELDNLLASGHGVRDVVGDTLRSLRKAFFKQDPQTGKVLLDQSKQPILETDPERLYIGTRRAIADKMSELSASDAANARQTARLLEPIQKQLDLTIAEGAPNYPAYMQGYNRLSRPIDEMRYLLNRKMGDAITGTPTLHQVHRTIEMIEQDQRARGITGGKSVSPQTLDQLQMLRDDLRRQANLQKGKSLGSDTYSNLAMSRVENALTAPISRAIGTGSAFFAGGAYSELGALAGAAGTAYGQNMLAKRELVTQAKLDAAILRLLKNENGEGTRAVLQRGAP